MDDDSDVESVPEQWAIIELMGRSKVAGRVRTDDVFGSTLIRIDVPFGNDFSTQFVNPDSAVFRITLVDEELARAAASSCQMSDPVSMSVSQVLRERSIREAAVLLNPKPASDDTGKNWDEDDRDFDN